MAIKLWKNGVQLGEVDGFDIPSTMDEPDNRINVADLVAKGAAETGGLLEGLTASVAELNILDTVTATAAEINALADVTPGTRAASKAVVLSSGSAIDQWDVAQTIVADAVTAAKRIVRSELTLTPANALACDPGISLAAIRGAVTLTTGKEITSGFLYGVQGKAVLDGATVSVGSDHIAGVYAQMSGNGAVLTDGHVAVIIASGQNLPTSANVDMIYAESGGGKVNSVLKAYVKASYLFDITNAESGDMVAAAGTGSGSPAENLGVAVPTRVLKVYVDGAAAYIPLYPTNV